MEELTRSEDSSLEEEEEDEGELALWGPEVSEVELQKETDRGLGFSLLDYQVRPGPRHRRASPAA